MKSNKVAIMTLCYKNYNYGGVLQAYALQKLIEDLGYSCEIIKFDRFFPRSIRQVILKLLREKLLNFFKSNADTDDLRIEEALERKRNKYELFIKTNISQSIDVYNHWNIKQCLSDYDTFICGSDQVWSPVSGRDETFLKFVPDNKKKIAYAASIGADDITLKFLCYIKPLIRRIEKISVREEGAKRIVESFLGKDACEIMPDPTLLLDIDEWDSVMCPVDKLVNVPFVLLYFIGEDSQNWNIAYDIAKKYGILIVNIPYNKMHFVERDFENKEISNYDVGPGEFVWLIKNARYVLTDSFHGTVFSIIYRKKYKYFSRMIENENGSMNGRIISLLKVFELPDDTTTCSVDYTQIGQCLDNQRERAVRFLREALDN